MKNQFGKALYIFGYAFCCEEPSYSINIWSCCEYALLVSRAILHSQFQRSNLRSAQNEGPLLQKPQAGYEEGKGGAIASIALSEDQSRRTVFCAIRCLLKPHLYRRFDLHRETFSYSHLYCINKHIYIYV